MKIKLTLYFLLIGVTVALAQRSDQTANLFHALRSDLQLDAEQQQAIDVIEARMERNRTEIEPLRQTDLEKYYLKRRALERNTDDSIRLLLRPEQMAVFKREIAERRTERNRVRKQLIADGADPDRIREATLAIY